MQESYDIAFVPGNRAQAGSRLAARPARRWGSAPESGGSAAQTPVRPFGGAAYSECYFADSSTAASCRVPYTPALTFVGRLNVTGTETTPVVTLTLLRSTVATISAALSLSISAARPRTRMVNSSVLSLYEAFSGTFITLTRVTLNVFETWFSKP